MDPGFGTVLKASVLRLYHGSIARAVDQKMKVALTEKQIRQCAIFFDRVRATAALGKPGMLVAQIRWNTDGRYWMEPAFLPNDVAQCIVEKGQGEVVLRALLATTPASNTAPRSVQTAPGEPTGNSGIVPSAHQ